MAAHGTEPVMPCVRLSAPGFDALDEALAGDPSVSAIVESNEFADEVEWSEGVTRRIDPRRRRTDTAREGVGRRLADRDPVRVA